MKAIARSLAIQMTAARITPQNVTSHAAYSDAGGRPWLAYAMDDNRKPVLGQYACSLHGDGNDWLLWDSHGVKSIAITYSDGKWQAQEPKNW